MPSVTIRISDKARQVLKELAGKERKPMQAILDKAIEAYRRLLFLEEANTAYAALRANPEAWKAELEERAAWDATLSDGLEDD